MDFYFEIPFITTAVITQGQGTTRGHTYSRVKSLDYGPPPSMDTPRPLGCMFRTWLAVRQRAAQVEGPGPTEMGVRSQKGLQPFHIKFLAVWKAFSYTRPKAFNSKGKGLIAATSPLERPCRRKK